MLTTDIKIGVSKGLALALIVTVAFCTASVLGLSISPLYKIILLLITFSYGLYILWRDCLLKSSHAVTFLSIHEDGWRIKTNQHVWQGELCGDSTLTYPTMVLRFKVVGRKRRISCIICRDSIDTHAYRQLLVLLRTTHAMHAEQTRLKRQLIL